MMGAPFLCTYGDTSKEAMKAGFLSLFICIPETIFAPSVILLQNLHGNKDCLQTSSQIRPHMAEGMKNELPGALFTDVAKSPPLKGN